MFGFELIDFGEGDRLDDTTRLCALRAGDRDVLLLFKKGGTPGTDVTGSVHVAFGIARADLTVWERWLAHPGFAIEFRKTWKYGAEALYFRDPDGNLLQVVTPGVVVDLLGHVS